VYYCIYVSVIGVLREWKKPVVVSEDFNSCNLMFEMSVFFWKEGVYLISSTYYYDGYILVQCISAVY